MVMIISHEVMLFLLTHSVYKCEDVVVLCGESAPECHLSIV